MTTYFQDGGNISQLSRCLLQHAAYTRHTTFHNIAAHCVHMYTCFNGICKSIEYGLLLHAYANVGHSLVLVAHVRFVLANEGPLS